jgi:glycosyltransferase involved in cell wall biosynthesis
MPAYNTAQYISKAIDSVLQQTYTRWELIIVDDGSTDDTATIAKRYAAKDKRVKYFYQSNAKQAAARNKGIHFSEGHYIAFLDADDLWKPYKLQKQVDFIAATQADVVFADVDVIDEHDNPLRSSWNVQDAVYKGDKGVLAFLQDNRAPVLTVLATKKALLEAGGFNESPDCQYVEDYDLWLRLLQRGFVFAGSSECLATYRQTIDQLPSRKKSILNVVDVVKKVSIKDPSLFGSVNTALIMWMRRCIQRCKPSVNASDMQQIIALFPAKAEQKLFAVLSHIIPANMLGNLVLLYTRKAVYRQHRFNNAT